MSKSVYIAIVSIVMAVTFSISTQAQSRSRQELKVNVPFAFSVGNISLPAGEYRLRVVNPASDRSVIQITNEDGSRIMVLTNDVKGESNTNAKLAFRHYGNQYFLAQVWMAAEPIGMATPQSKVEKQLLRQLGNGAKDSGMVAVNAR